MVEASSSTALRRWKTVYAGVRRHTVRPHAGCSRIWCERPVRLDPRGVVYYRKCGEKLRSRRAGADRQRDRASEVPSFVLSCRCLSQQAPRPSSGPTLQLNRGERIHAHISRSCTSCSAWRSVSMPAPPPPSTARNRPLIARPGENYHVEIGGFLWFPSPDIAHHERVAGDHRVEDRLRHGPRNRDEHVQADTRRAARPSTRNKFRFEYTPITLHGHGYAEAGRSSSTASATRFHCRSRPS